MIWRDQPDKIPWPFSQEELESALEIIWDGHGVCKTADRHIWDSIDNYNINQSPKIPFDYVSEGIVCQFCPLKAAEMLADGSRCITSKGAFKNIDKWKAERIYTLI